MSSEPPEPRRSSTLVLLREVGRSVEVLMLLRADRGDQNSLRWVFPGGLLDATDAHARSHFHGIDDGAASRRLGVEKDGLDYWTAALRETLEEAGVLIALDAHGPPADAAAHEPAVARWRQRAQELPHGQAGASFAALCAEQRWRLPGSAVLPLAHWITPLGMPKRFDTRFFVCAAPAHCEVRVDGVEVTEHRWVPITDLAEQRSDVAVRGPTLAVAKDLARHATVEAALAWARAIPAFEPVCPRLALDASGQRRPVPPWHPAWTEVGRIDPQGRRLAYSVIRPGAAVELTADRLVRITARNGSVMTGPGTNTYLLRCAGDDWVAIDPGPDDPAHVDALVGELKRRGARLQAILVTHTHVDHSPAALTLKRATGATLIGRLADHRGGQDGSFAAERVPDDGERLDFGGGCVLRAILTPGHASNHLCWLHEGERLLFTGDHVMQGSTVVINPPDGDMAAYLASLRRVADEAGVTYDAMAPGHGFLIGRPMRALEALIVHRRRREAKVRQAIADAGSATVDELLPRVYDDVPDSRHAVARRSLLAHLLHLQQQGLAIEYARGWTLINE
jgi:glyoxylase-like metal-dependent hydrolase (beta-lactamase superfamily II)/8-oxo-dGTP pyrophosphatase MutT (NUDIX family)